MAVTIQVKRGSRATLPVLALGEYGLTTDTKELFIGGPEGVNIQIAVLDNGGQIPEEQLPEMDEGYMEVEIGSGSYHFGK